MNKYFIGIALPSKEALMAKKMVARLASYYGSTIKSPFDKYPPHITLKVTFPATPSQLHALSNHMQTFVKGRPSIPVHLGGFGHFNVGVLYWDVIQESDALTQLQKDMCDSLEESFEWMKFDPVEPNGIPHITITKDGIRGRFRNVFQYAITHCSATSELSVNALHLFEKKEGETQWTIINTFQF